MNRLRKRSKLALRTALGGLLLCFGVLAVFQPVDAAINKQVNFQGRLTDTNGNVVADGDYNMEFKLHNHATNTGGGQGACSGSCLWMETRTSTKVTVSRGLFSIQLGEIASLASFNFNQDPLYLSVRVGGTGTPSWDSEMTPRHRLGASPQAIYSADSDALDGNDSTFFTNSSNQSSGTLPTGRISGSYTGLTGTGALDAGSITSNFGAIDTGADNITTSGIVTGGTLSGATVRGGTGSGGNMTLSSTSSGTKGKILFGNSAYDEANNRLGIGTQSPGAGNLIDVNGNSSNTLINLISGNASNYAAVSVGRTGTEATFSVSAAANQFLDGTVAGTVAVKGNGGSLQLGVSNAGDSVVVRSNNVSDAMFVARSTAGNTLFNIDSDATTGNLNVSVGDTSTTNAPVMFGVDHEDADPLTAVNGSMYYNIGSNKLRCMENNLWKDCDTVGGAGATTLQQAYDATSGNTISTSATSQRDLALTLANNALGTDSNFTITTADGSTGSTVFSRADGAGTVDPAQLILVDNLDTTRAIADGIKIQAAAGKITDGLDVSDSELDNAINIGSNDILTGATTIASTELDRLDGKDAALVDINDAVATAITGTGALNAGSITSGFGAIDTGADNITTTGTVTTGSLTVNDTSTFGDSAQTGTVVGITAATGNTGFLNQSTSGNSPFFTMYNGTQRFSFRSDSTELSFGHGGQTGGYTPTFYLDNTGDAAFVASTDSQAAFRVMENGLQAVLTVDTEETTDVRKVLIGDTGTTNPISLLQLDNEDTEPTAAAALNGSMYYSTSLGKFRCHQAGAWTDCIGTGGGGGGTLQQAYTASTGGTTPEIKLDSTRGTLNIQDADSTIGSNLLSVTASNGSGIGSNLFSVGNTGNAVFQTSSASTSALAVNDENGFLLLGADSSTTANLLATNPGFEINTTGWAAKGTVSGGVTRSTAQSYAGVASASLNPTAANSGASYNVTLSATTQYTLSVYVKASGANFSTFDIGRQDVSGTDIDCNNPDLTAYTAGWVRYSCTFTTGGTITNPNIYVKQTDATNRTWFIDAVQLVQSANPGGYNPGGTVQIRGLVNNPVVFQNKEDSNTAFQVNSAGGTPILNVDTVTGADSIGVEIGSPQTDANASLLTLDSYNQSSDPTGQVGAMYYNTTTGRFRCYNADGWKNCSAQGSPSGDYVIREDFYSANVTSLQMGELGWTSGVSGTGAAVNKSGTVVAGRPGLQTLTTGTVATGRAAINLGSGNSLILESDTVIEFAVNIPALSNATNRYTLRMGLGDSDTADFTDGVYFEYSDNINTGQWVVKSASNGTRTTTNSTTAATTGYHRFKIVFNAAGNLATYYVDGTSIGTVNANFPTGAGRGSAPYFQLIKGLGTTATTLDVDYFYLYHDLTTLR